MCRSPSRDAQNALKWRCMWNTNGMILMEIELLGEKRASVPLFLPFVSHGRPQCPRGPMHIWCHSFSRISLSNVAGSMSVCCECCVLSGRGQCLGLITRPEESYSLCVCMSLSVIRCTIDLLHLHWGVRRGQTKEERKKETEKEINKERAKEREVSHSLAYSWPSFRLNFSAYCVKNLYIIHRENNRSQLKTQVKGKTITVFS